MKTILQANFYKAIVLMILGLYCNTVRGQVTLPAASPYTQDFNVTPGAAGTQYPAGWTSYNGAAADAAMTTGGATSTTGANYNYGSRIGILGSGSNFDPSSIVLTLTNTSNKNNFKISYDIIRIRDEGRTNKFDLEISTTSATSGFTAVSGGAYSSSVTAATTNYSNIAIPAALNNIATNVWIRWSYANTGGSGSRDGLALDNVSISYDVFTTWNGSGWSNGAPTATVEAIISGNYNTATNGAITCKNLTITSGNLVVGTNGLTVKGTLAKTGGTVNAEAGDVTFSGTAAQSILSGFFVNNTVKNLTITNTAGVTLANTLSLTGTLSVTSGTFATAGFLTLKSNAGGNARVAAVGGAITGAVAVERYIPEGKRAFRFLTPGVTTTNFISNNWQQGTHITGSATGLNGFDATQTGSPSMYTYNNTIASGTGWTAIPSTNATNLTAGIGYRILIRGNRSVDISQASEAAMNAPVTLTAKGTLRTGSVVFNTASTPAINGTVNPVTNGFSLIGNPYVSPVDWHLVTKAGLENVYYGWDPNMGTAAQRGRYVAYSQATGLNNLPESNIGRYIQPGQAFFVKNNVLGTAGTLTFNEANKAANAAEIFRPEADTDTAANSTLSISLYDASELQQGFPIDGTVAVFGTDFSNGFGLGDVEKLYTSGEHLGLSVNDKALAIEAREPVVENDELRIKTMLFQADKSYAFRISAQSFAAGTTAVLLDNYLNTETPLDLEAGAVVPFSSTADPASYTDSRFSIVFHNAALGAERQETAEIKVYPNPVTGNRFNIALPKGLAGNVSIRVYNLLGQEMYHVAAPAQNSIEVAPNVTMASGIYSVVVESGNQSFKQKIAIK